jgi:ribosomal protein L40E
MISPLERAMTLHLDTTLCWRCNSEYPIDLYACPQCNAINGNVDLEGALKQQDDSHEKS